MTSIARTGISSEVVSQKFPNRLTPASTTSTTSPAKQNDAAHLRADLTGVKMPTANFLVAHAAEETVDHPKV
jgi:hypothetical protein